MRINALETRALVNKAIDEIAKDHKEGGSAYNIKSDKFYDNCANYILNDIYKNIVSGVKKGEEDFKFMIKQNTSRYELFSSHIPFLKDILKETELENYLLGYAEGVNAAKNNVYDERTPRNPYTTANIEAINGNYIEIVPKIIGNAETTKFLIDLKNYGYYEGYTHQEYTTKTAMRRRRGGVIKRVLLDLYKRGYYAVDYEDVMDGSWYTFIRITIPSLPM